MWRILAVAVFLFVAGCGDAPDAGEVPEAPADSPAASGDGAATTLDVPAWSVGDWWTFQVSFPSGSFETSRIVTSTDGAYRIDTDNPDTAWTHHLEAVSIMGEVSKQHLDGSQEAGPVKFFDFPLEANKTWTMTWDNQAFEAVVESVDDGVVTIAYMHNGTKAREVVYHAEARWMSRMAAFADGQELFSMALTHYGTNWTGNIVRWAVFADDGDSGPGYTRRTLEVPAEAEEVWFRAHGPCGDGSARFALYPSSPETLPLVEHQAICPTEIDTEDTVSATEGDWVIQAQALNVDLSWRVAVRTLHVMDLATASGNGQEAA